MIYKCGLIPTAKSKREVRKLNYIVILVYCCIKDFLFYWKKHNCRFATGTQRLVLETSICTGTLWYLCFYLCFTKLIAHCAFLSNFLNIVISRIQDIAIFQLYQPGNTSYSLQSGYAKDMLKLFLWLRAHMHKRLNQGLGLIVLYNGLKLKYKPWLSHVVNTGLDIFISSSC